jgi:hypothetical protein
MSTRYIEIDSTWRNRNLYPNPSNFEIPISESGAKSSDTALSPVCCSSPIIEWKLGNFNTNVSATSADRKFVGIVITEYLGDSIYQVCQKDTNILQNINGYYNCAIITNGTTSATQTVFGVIKNFSYLGNGKATLQLNTTLSLSTPIVGTELYISDPTYLSINTATGKFNTLDPYIFIPTGFPGSNAYNEFIISNTTKDQYRETTDYNGSTKLLGVDISGSPTSTHNSGPIDNWDDTDILVLRSVRTQTSFVATPIATEFTSQEVFPGGVLTPANSYINELSKRVFQTDQIDALTIPQVGNFLEKTSYYNVLSNLTILSLNTLSYSYGGTELPFAIPNYFTGAEIKAFNAPAASDFINNQIRTVRISYYDSTTGNIVLELESDLTIDATMASPIGSTFDCTVRIKSEFARITKYVNLNSIAGSNSTIDFIEFPFGSSEENNFYNELYIKVTTGAVTDTRIIKQYSVEKNEFGAIILAGAFLNRNLTVAPNATTTFSISSGILFPPFKNFIAKSSATGTINEFVYELLPFSYDGFNPFVYTGSMLSQTEQVCYSIELKNLVLPNQVLDGGFGSLIPFYPYIYVELQNVSAPGSGLNNIIYSNNPNSTKMMFRVPITDVPNPVNSTFIKLDSRGTVQTLKFKPNDNLKFGVYLSDGTPYTTLLQDTSPPMKPNALVQISALFAIRRLD